METTMRLHAQPFEQIKSGAKTIEARLYDEKRQQLNVGDVIEFSSRNDLSKKIRVRITNLLQHDTFAELFNTHPPELFGGKSTEELMGIYKYYSLDDEKKYGVLGIKFALINY